MKTDKNHSISIRVPNEIYNSLIEETKKKDSTLTEAVLNRLQTNKIDGPKLLDAIIQLENTLNTLPDQLSIRKERERIWQLLK